VRKLPILLLAALLLSRPAAGADLSRYFPDPAAEDSSRRALATQTQDFLHEKSPWTAKTAAKHLELGADLLRGWMRHFVYCRARAADDVTDAAAKRCVAESDDNFGAVDAFVGIQLQSPIFTKMDEKALTRSGLIPYRAPSCRSCRPWRGRCAGRADAAGAL
jgi:hypothetical protein